MAAAGLDVDVNFWWAVFDFNDEAKTGANWRLLPEGERPAWRDAIFDCVEACMLHHKHLWAKTTVDMVVKAMVDRRENFSEEQPRAERALHPV